MESNLPAPTMRLFRRETRVFMPTSIEELVGSVGQIAPSQCGNCIDDGDEIVLARLQSLFRTRIADSERRLIRKQTQPSELLWTEWVAAENGDNAQQSVSEDEGMACETPNLLTFRPLWSYNPIVLSRDVFDENRMPACCHLTDLPDTERHSSKAPLQKTPIFTR